MAAAAHSEGLDIDRYLGNVAMQQQPSGANAALSPPPAAADAFRHRANIDIDALVGSRSASAAGFLSMDLDSHLEYARMNPIAPGCGDALGAYDTGGKGGACFLRWSECLLIHEGVFRWFVCRRLWWWMQRFRHNVRSRSKRW
jgi:hypothetical protein